MERDRPVHGSHVNVSLDPGQPDRPVVRFGAHVRAPRNEDHKVDVPVVRRAARANVPLISSDPHLPDEVARRVLAPCYGANSGLDVYAVPVPTPDRYGAVVVGLGAEQTARRLAISSIPDLAMRHATPALVVATVLEPILLILL